MVDQKMVILTSYFKGDSFGMLGPQMATTLIRDHAGYDVMVVGVAREDDKILLKTALVKYFGSDRPVVGFSSLGGRPDLFEFAGHLKKEGAITILGGPQAGPDFLGEIGWQEYPHRFKGVSDCFSFAVHGPVQQLFPVLKSGFRADLSTLPGLVYVDKAGRLNQNPSSPWEDQYLSAVDWKTLYVLQYRELVPLEVSLAQMLQQIGCPHAAAAREISVDYPAALGKKGKTITFLQKGCSFCDVATDKGYTGTLGKPALVRQLQNLPLMSDGRVIPFELINESPVTRLSALLDLARELKLRLSQINLTLRADYFLKGRALFEKTLETAQAEDIRILFSSIGFESFSDRILKNLNKGVTKALNLQAVHVIRELKQKYPRHFGYTRFEGANHGFIHPTPWDDEQSISETEGTILEHQLSHDILPNHSTPLIIHHASGLAGWIREIETRENIRFSRHGSTIGWWRIGDRFLL